MIASQPQLKAMKAMTFSQCPESAHVSWSFIPCMTDRRQGTCWPWKAVVTGGDRGQHPAGPETCRQDHALYPI